MTVHVRFPHSNYCLSLLMNLRIWLGCGKNEIGVSVRWFGLIVVVARSAQQFWDAQLTNFVGMALSSLPLGACDRAFEPSSCSLPCTQWKVCVLERLRWWGNPFLIRWIIHDKDKVSSYDESFGLIVVVFCSAKKIVLYAIANTFTCINNFGMSNLRIWIG